jgi:hypothetical protein
MKSAEIARPRQILERAGEAVTILPTVTVTIDSEI